MLKVTPSTHKLTALSCIHVRTILAVNVPEVTRSMPTIHVPKATSDRGVWLRVAKQFLSCALVRGSGVVFRHYYKSIAKCAGKDYRDGAVVPFE